MQTPEALLAAIEGYLEELALTPELGGLAEPMRYALAGGGKRIRPLLCLATGEALGREAEELLPAAAALELVRGHPENVPLDGAEPVGRPSFRRGCDPGVELLDAAPDGLGRLQREIVHLALVQGGEGLAGHIPLVEQEERGPAGGAAAESHRSTSSSTATSTLATSSPNIVSSASRTRSCTASASWGRTTP